MTSATLANILGPDFQQGESGWYKETENGTRIEVTGSCNDKYNRHFNVYVIQNGQEIAQSTGVPQDKLAKEIEALAKLSANA